MRKECIVSELNVKNDDSHLLVSVAPKLSILKLMDTWKGKLAIKVYKSYPKLKEKIYWDSHFGVRGYFISTVGLVGDTLRTYVKYQEEEEKQVVEKPTKVLF